MFDSVPWMVGSYQPSTDEVFESFQIKKNKTLKTGQMLIYILIFVKHKVYQA